MRNLAETPDDPPLRLNPQLDYALIARVYRAKGRVHVPDFFDAATAARIHRALAKETPWQERAYRAAAHGFSYRYANFRLYENWQRDGYRDLWLMRLLEFLNAPPFRDLMRRVTGWLRQRPAGAAVS